MYQSRCACILNSLTNPGEPLDDWPMPLEEDDAPKGGGGGFLAVIVGMRK